MSDDQNNALEATGTEVAKNVSTLEKTPNPELEAEDAEKGKVKVWLKVQPPSQGSLLSRAKSEHDEITLDEEAVAIVSRQPGVEDEPEPLENTAVTESPDNGIRPFSPPLSEPDSPLQEEIEALSDFDDYSGAGERGGEAGGGNAGGNESSQQQAPQVQMEQLQSGGGTSYADIMGLGSMVGAIAAFAARNKSPEAIQAKAAASYQKQQQKLDQIIFNAKNHAFDLKSSHVGLTQKGYLDQGIEPPADAMASAYVLDKGAQKSWAGMQAQMTAMEGVVTGMQKSAAQAGFGPDSTHADISDKVNGFADAMEDNLAGMTDEKGNKLSELIRQSSNRMTEILKQIMESIKGLFTQSSSMKQTSE